MNDALDADVPHVVDARLVTDALRLRVVVFDVLDRRVCQRPRDQNRLTRARLDIANREAVSVAQRRDAAPRRVRVADSNRRAIDDARRRLVYDVLDEDVVELDSRPVEEPDDLMTARRVSGDVANFDVMDVEVLLLRIVADLRRAEYAAFLRLRNDRRDRDEVVARASADSPDDDVAAPFAKVEPVDVEDLDVPTVDLARLRRIESQVFDDPVRAFFERNAPCVRVDDRNVSDRKLVDVREKNPDIAPVSRLRFALFARVRPVRALPEFLAAVACRPRMIRADEFRVAAPDDADVFNRRDLLDSRAAVRAADEVVAAFVGELQRAGF